jgi:bifunctional DNA-binding transcriptional regulator/antitoxin component of YhaV-PrlF toxin-antitoxin module
MNDIPEIPALVGDQLLQAVDLYTNKGYSKRKVMVACGYGGVGADGRKYCRIADFYDAVMAAKGVMVGATNTSGRQLSYETRVQKTGTVVIGKSYTERMGLAPGEVLQILLSPDGGVIGLQRREQDEAETLLEALAEDSAVASSYGVELEAEPEMAAA